MEAVLLTTGALGVLICANGMMTDHQVGRLDLIIGASLVTLALGFAIYFYV